MATPLNRRATLAGIGAASLFASQAHAQDMDLENDAPRGEMGEYDAVYLGPPASRGAKRDFKFPADADDSHTAYGIDISHHVAEVPWAALRAAKVNYVYMKASQNTRSRDRKFVAHWQAAEAAGIPCGAYHFLTAGSPGADQAANFLRRLAEVGGLRGGGVHLQPVLDLEWDYLGPTFTRVPIVGAGGDTTYKDYWVDYSKDQIVQIAQDFINALVTAYPNLQLRPVIYTNKSWWDVCLDSTVRFPNCTIWTSDYRRASYTNNSPRSAPGHPVHLWQFTDRGEIVTADRTYRGFDCNKFVDGSIADVLIA